MKKKIISLFWPILSESIPSIVPTYSQCDQIGQFFKVLGNNFAYKSSQKRLVTFWAISKRIILWKNCFFYYLGNFWKHLGYPLTPTSGHTAFNVELKWLSIFQGLGYWNVWKPPMGPQVQPNPVKVKWYDLGTKILIFELMWSNNTKD